MLMSLYGDIGADAVMSKVMLRFSIFGFPIMVHWLFWLIAFLIGGGLGMQSAQDWPRVFVGMTVIFLSILVHELGHAFAARAFGQRPGIVFHGLGGLTFFNGPRLSRWPHFFMVAAGPASSLLLALFFFMMLPFQELSPLLPLFIGFGLWVNIVWTVINCLPVLPLDGGQMLRDLLGKKSEKICCWIGAVVAVGIAVLAALSKMYILAVLMGFLAYSNFRGTTSLQGGVVRQS